MPSGGPPRRPEHAPHLLELRGVYVSAREPGAKLAKRFVLGVAANGLDDPHDNEDDTRDEGEPGQEAGMTGKPGLPEAR